MPSHDFIDVRIVADDSPLTEYPNPESGSDEDRVHTRYIEAKTGQIFGVRIRTLPGFNFQFAPFLYYKYFLDDNPNIHNGYIEKVPHARRNGIVRSQVECFTNGISFKDDQTGDWAIHPFMFGPLGTSKVFVPSPPFSDVEYDVTADLFKMNQHIQLLSSRNKWQKLGRFVSLSTEPGEQSWLFPFPILKKDRKCSTRSLKSVSKGKP